MCSEGARCSDNVYNVYLRKRSSDNISTFSHLQHLPQRLSRPFPRLLVKTWRLISTSTLKMYNYYHEKWVPTNIRLAAGPTDLWLFSQYNCSLLVEFKFKKLFSNFQLTFWLLNEETLAVSRSSRENIFWVTEENIWSICHFGRCHGGGGGRSVRLSVVTRTGTYFSETCHRWKLLWLWLPMINKYMAQYENVKSVEA